MIRSSIQRKRATYQVAFFTLFVLAPVLDIFRLDLYLGHAILFGFDWTLGIDEFIAGRAGIGEAAFNLFWRGFLPLFGVGGLIIWVAWRYGRLYCGWLCPHFSVVELINNLMLRASGKPSLWERRPLPQQRPGGEVLKPQSGYWIPTIVAVLFFAFLWAVVLLTYLLPPVEIYGNLFTGELTRNQTLFITAATLALTVEFLLARHLFCRFACAVGLFQSLAWMANNKAMVVGFDTSRANSCHDCNNACDSACPMRLKPRTMKRKMFTCTECGECISACAKVQQGTEPGSLLRWVDGQCALPVVTGRTRNADGGCFPSDGMRRTPEGATARVPTMTPQQKDA